ncbi:hypothetical protein GDO78_020488 [Eleutherodactylus coqui]|uniref:Ubinuclein 1 n=1 Tax=Eleutherodactylus coqui TaxID=57060 RepID=A0A8J6EI67_ELECQ|nr:hypothetical protein GDO78_020488 [Eleutherodactylus coqui]
MAEPRRVQLSTVASNAPLQPPSPKKPRTDERDPETSVAATVRIALTLFEPDQKKCPEFFYPELLRKLKGSGEKRAEKSQKKQLDPFNDEDTERKEVEALSKKFEEKYGKKRRRDRVQDLIDMGYGYDDSDSFIDNSEAYDELVPASLNTKYGGFYINSGTLQFRQASESEDDSVRQKKKKSPKKMKERGEKVKKRKREEEKKSKKSKYSKSGFTALNGTKDKKKKKMANLQDMLAKFERDKKVFEQWTPPAAVIIASKSSLSASSLSNPTGPSLPPRDAELAPDPLLSTIVSEKELLQDASTLDSLSKKEPEKLDAPPEKGSGGPAREVIKEEFKKPPSVPEGLPPAIEKRIKELAKRVNTADGDKKIKLFSPEMNVALLDIYLLSRELSPGLRSSVFGHLSSILPCSKDTLVQWSSRLYLHKQGDRLREPLQKLKEAVAKAMPEQIIKYHVELKVHNEAKYAKMLSDDKEKEQKTLSEEEEEEDKGSKKAAGPRKKFQWSEEIRQLLCQLVRMKVDIYEPEGSGMSSLEDYLKCFLDQEVKPLWPRGWMQARVLFKESRRLHPQLSSLMAKNKAVFPPKMKVKESSNKPEKNIATSSIETPAVPTAAPAKDGPPPVVSSVVSPVSAHTQDNSLDGDLIHNPPSLDAVSEHLTALSGRTSGLVFEFSTPSKSSGAEKPTMVEEKKKPCPPISVVTITTTSQPLARPVFQKKFMPTDSEKKMPPPVPIPRPLPEAQLKQKPPPQPQPGPAKTQTANPPVQPSINIYQIINKGCLTHPVQSGVAKVSAPSPSQQPLAPHTKPPKPQGIPPSQSPSGTGHKPVLSPGFIIKQPNNLGPVGAQVCRGAVNRLPAPPHANLGNTGGQNSTMTLNQPPSSAIRVATATSTKMPPRLPQKLTLMAPQDSGRGTQGVAKLLTSSMVARGGGNTTSIISSQKGGGAPGLVGSTPLTILTSAYKQNGGKLPASASLSLLSPINPFPLRVVSFTTEPSPKAGVSKDAIVTGPAPGTFNHGLPRNILGGLHSSTSHHSAPLPRPVLSGHMQPAPTADGAHTHGKGTVPSQMRTGRPNNP